jgi:hypothetical protein
MRILGFAGLVMAALSAYAVYYCWPPRDLALVSVRVVGGDDAQIPEDVGPRDSKHLLAIVSFRTSKNLARFAQNGLYEEIFNDQYVCGAVDKEKERVGGGEPLVYDSYGAVGLAEIPKQKIGHPVYRIYTDLQEDIVEQEDGVEEVVRYDLVRNPQDVCFVVTPQLSFVGMWPPSNEVRIPRELLVKAIDQYQRAHAAGSHDAKK